MIPLRNKSVGQQCPFLVVLEEPGDFEVLTYVQCDLVPGSVVSLFPSHLQPVLLQGVLLCWYQPIESQSHFICVIALNPHYHV